MFVASALTFWEYSKVEVCTSLTQLIGVEQVLTVGFRSEANGIVERMDVEVKRHLQVIVNEKQNQNKWSLVLPLVQRILNSSVSSRCKSEESF